MEVGCIDPGRLVFVEEMATHTSLAPPVYAYAPVGERAFLEIPRNRGENTTLVASLRSGGMAPSMAVEGVTTKEVFETYVEHFLAPELEPGQEVVVMDNLGAHTPERVRQLIEGRGCELIYLPPYSPDLLNPIEEAFAKIKHIPSGRCVPAPRRLSSRRWGGHWEVSIQKTYGILRSLWLPHPGAATMKDAVRSYRSHPAPYDLSRTRNSRHSGEQGWEAGAPLSSGPSKAVGTALDSGRRALPPLGCGGAGAAGHAYEERRCRVHVDLTLGMSLDIR